MNPQLTIIEVFEQYRWWNGMSFQIAMKGYPDCDIFFMGAVILNDKLE